MQSGFSEQFQKQIDQLDISNRRGLAENLEPPFKMLQYQTVRSFVGHRGKGKPFDCPLFFKISMIEICPCQAEKIGRLERNPAFVLACLDQLMFEGLLPKPEQPAVFQKRRIDLVVAKSMGQSRQFVSETGKKLLLLRQYVKAAWDFSRGFLYYRRDFFRPTNVQVVG